MKRIITLSDVREEREMQEAREMGIAIATTPSRCVSSSCRPHYINKFIDTVLKFNRTGQATN